MVLVVDLHCAQGHVFEGWFASADDLGAQQAKGLLSCPVCGDLQVTRRPSAVRLNVSHLKREATSETKSEGGHRPSTDRSPAATQPAVDPERAAAEADAKAHLKALYYQVVKDVIAQTEDVGEQFADEARSIHHGDAPARAIRGQTTPEQREALREEGIDVLSLPVPASLKGPVQ